MKSQTINAHINPDNRLNTTHHIAWVLAERISKWSIWNLLLWFKPLKIYSIRLIACEPCDPTDTFTADMFKEGAFLDHSALNHYMTVYQSGKPHKMFMLNCGALLQNFAYSDYDGYKALKEITKLAYDSDYTKNTPSVIQEKVSSNPEGSTGVSDWESDGGSTGSDKPDVSSDKGDE